MGGLMFFLEKMVEAALKLPFSLLILTATIITGIAMFTPRWRNTENATEGVIADHYGVRHRIWNKFSGTFNMGTMGSRVLGCCVCIGDLDLIWSFDGILQNPYSWLALRLDFADYIAHSFLGIISHSLCYQLQCSIW